MKASLRPAYFVLLSLEYWLLGLTVIRLILFVQGACRSGPHLLYCLGEQPAVRIGFPVVAVGYIGVVALLRRMSDENWKWWMGEEAAAATFALLALLFVSNGDWLTAGVFAVMTGIGVVIAVRARRKRAGARAR